jgi:hypothetical protein
METQAQPFPQAVAAGAHPRLAPHRLARAHDRQLATLFVRADDREGAKPACLKRLAFFSDDENRSYFTKTGSGQTEEAAGKTPRRLFSGDYSYGNLEDERSPFSHRRWRRLVRRNRFLFRSAAAHLFT